VAFALFKRQLDAAPGAPQRVENNTTDGFKVKLSKGL
jgi:hypothetical protein